MKSPHSSSRRLTMLLFILSATVPVKAEMVTMISTADTTLFKQAPNDNFGAVATMIGGGIADGNANRALIKFDLGQSIPSNAIIDSVTVRLTVVNAHQTLGVDSVFGLHRVLRSWGEGNKIDPLNARLGDPATEGEATWNARFHPATLWAMPGAAAGTDYVAVASSSQLIGNTIPQAYTFGSTAALVADVQSWATNATGNSGWILISQSENTRFTARRIASHEDESNAPQLVVQYSVAPQAPQIQFVERSATNINMHFTAEAMFCYAVEFRTSLNPGSWSTLTNFCMPAATQNVVVSDSLSASSNRFYRLSRTALMVP